jgi:hypothetical protein
LDTDAPLMAIGAGAARTARVELPEAAHHRAIQCMMPEQELCSRPLLERAGGTGQERESAGALECGRGRGHQEGIRMPGTRPDRSARVSTTASVNAI